MTARRAYDMNTEVSITLVTPEDAPLAIFGQAVSEAVEGCSSNRGSSRSPRRIARPRRPARSRSTPAGDASTSIASSRYPSCTVPRSPVYRPMTATALSTSTCTARCRAWRASTRPAMRPLPGQARGDRRPAGRRRGGGDRCRAGASVEPSKFNPVIHGMLLGGEKPLYLSAQITGGHGSASEVSETPTWSPPTKIVAKYLAPYLESRDEKTPR